MMTPPASEPYESTVGASARAMAGFERTATGDPRKVAQLVLAIAGFDDPPCGSFPAVTPTSTAARHGGTASRPTRNGRTSAGPPTTTRPGTAGTGNEAAASPTCTPDRRGGLSAGGGP